VSVVPNPLPDGTWTANPPSDDARENVVLYAGRIHPEKGLDLLAEAWVQPKVRAALAGWKLVLAGSWDFAHGGGGANYQERLKAKFKLASDSVEWTGPLFGANTEKLHQLYQRARIFVYPSVADRGETFGLAPLEAMACGAPPIVSNLGCFRDFVRAGENGLVFDHHAPDAGSRLADALLSLAGDAALRRRLGAEAWKTAAHYRVEEVATRYLADFESVLAQSAV
jgi:glycosyltransferase involved in cell wall biosynthesis